MQKVFLLPIFFFLNLYLIPKILCRHISHLSALPAYLSNGWRTAFGHITLIFCTTLELNPLLLHCSITGMTSFSASWYPKSKEFTFFGSKPLFRRNSVHAFTFMVSRKHERATIVHLRFFAFTVYDPIFWSTMSVPPFVNSYSLYSAGIRLSLSFMTPSSGLIVDISSLFIFPFEWNIAGNVAVAIVLSIYFTAEYFSVSGHFNIW